jgi:PH (Pleckstrin Homology) domain-containing protein
MPAYTDRSKRSDEVVVCRPHQHWIIYKRAFFLLLLAIAVVIGGYASPFGLNRIIWLVASALTIRAGIYAISAAYKQFSVEMSVTDRRVIVKRGIVWVSTAEMFIPAVESFFDEQGVLGRILNYGSIHVRGEGESFEHLHYIANPLRGAGGDQQQIVGALASAASGLVESAPGA